MQKSVYFPDDEQTQGILKQVDLLGTINRRSFSELVCEGLRLLVGRAKETDNDIISLSKSNEEKN